jgi:sister chromatid cohesion protein DCC1
MEPFLRTLGREGDKKSRDKMVGKFVRVVKEREGVWWYPRRMM